MTVVIEKGVFVVGNTKKNKKGSFFFFPKIHIVKENKVHVETHRMVKRHAMTKVKNKSKADMCEHPAGMQDTPWGCRKPWSGERE